MLRASRVGGRRGRAGRCAVWGGARRARAATGGRGGPCPHACSSLGGEVGRFAHGPGPCALPRAGGAGAGSLLGRWG